MDRRQILQLGAALTTLPLTGCSGGALPPQSAPPAGPPAPASDKAAVVTPDTAATADSSALPPEARSTDTQATPASEEAPKISFTRVIGRLGRNHGHALTLSLADVTAGGEIDDRQ